MVSEIVDLVLSKYDLSELSKKYLEDNLKSGSRNLFVFYQANIQNSEEYPVATLLFLLNDIKEILDKTHGKLYFFYHNPNIISEVQKDKFYNSQKGIEAYTNQLNNIRKLSKYVLDLDLELVSLQDYVEKFESVGRVYNLLKNEYPFEEDVLFWLSKLSRPAVERILRDTFGGGKAVSLMNHLFIKKDNKQPESKELINKNYQKIIENPLFEKYLVYELLASISIPYTHNAVFRPNIGANQSMQDWAQELSLDFRINNIFNNKKQYVLVNSLSHMNLPFSFVHMQKKEKGVVLELNRTNKIHTIDDILNTNSVYKKQYFSIFDKRFPDWKSLIQKTIEFNESNGIFQTEISIEEQPLNKQILIKQDSTDIPDDIKVLVEKRMAARLRKDWVIADSIRDEIIRRGYYLEDKPLSDFDFL